MPVDVRPAIPIALPRSALSSPGRRRLLRFVATALTAVTATLAILLVAVGAVMLGMS
jgi:hypothetical protein